MKLIIIEGIPGSGKTTTAKLIEEHYRSIGKKVKKYQEGDLHPVDLAWCAVMTEHEYDHALKMCDEVVDNIKRHTKKSGDKYIVAYTKIGLPMKDPRITTLFEPKEVYGARVDKDTFIRIHRSLWNEFFSSTHDEDIAIFECTFLQNHVVELMLTYNCDEKTIIKEVTALIPSSDQIEVELIYLDCLNVKETIDRVAKERVSSDKSKWDDWIDLVLKYIKDSEYGKANHCDSLEDVYAFFEKRIALEHQIMSQLNIQTQLIPNPDYDWDARWLMIKEKLL